MIKANSEGVEKLTSLKNKVKELGPKGMPLYSEADNIGLLSPEVNALVKMGIISRSGRKASSKRYMYSWNGPDPSISLVKKMMKKVKDISKDGIEKRTVDKEPEQSFFQGAPVKEPVEQKKEEKQVIATKEGVAIPISVQVDTDGSKKSVTIRIEI